MTVFPGCPRTLATALDILGNPCYNILAQQAQPTVRILFLVMPPATPSRCLLSNNAAAGSKRASFVKGLIMSALLWTDREIAILKKYYPYEGLAITKRLPNRTQPAVGHKAERLGIAAERRFNPEEPGTFWTGEEIKILKSHFPLEGAGVIKYLPGRTKISVKHKAERLGIKYRYRFEQHRIRKGIEEKRCNLCNRWKSLDEFSRCSKHHDGLQHTCKACVNERHYDNLESNRARSRRHYEANRNDYILRVAERRVLENQGDLTTETWQGIVDQYIRCPYCGHPFDDDVRKLTIDHVIPLDRGGQHTKGNVLPVCSRCNHEKFTRLLGEEWLPWDLYDEQGQLTGSS